MDSLKRPRILVIDDDYGESRALRDGFVSKVDPGARYDFEFISGQRDGQNSLPAVIDHVGRGWPPRSAAPHWALVLLDVHFGQRPAQDEDDRWGFVLLRALRARWDDLPIVMLTSEGEAKRREANWGLASGFLPKPHHTSSSSELDFLTRLYSFGLFPDQREGGRLAGSSVAALKVLRDARRFACDPLGAGRIIYGESGTGKTELARFIHDEMRVAAGRTGSFRTWSAAGTNEDIAKDALFGHWKGAHSQAFSHEPGEIEKADGGTFFLDEVSSLPVGVQALFLESRRRNSQLRRLLRRMGTLRTTPIKEVADAKASIVPGEEYLEPDNRIAVDVVMLTASNVNLHDEEVAETLGFRQDLLNDLGEPILLPALNDRREDIPEIFEHIVSQIVTHLGRSMKLIDDGVYSELQSRDWTKKNIVALRQIAERAVISARDFDEILVRHLPPPVELPSWAGSRAPIRGKRIEATSGAGAGDEGSPQVPCFRDIPDLLAKVDVGEDSELLNGILPRLQESYATLVLRLFAAALRSTKDRRGESSSLSAVCKLLGTSSLGRTPETYAAYDVVLRLVSLCDVRFEGLPAERCELLTEDPEARDRIAQALAQRRRPRRAQT